MHIKVHYHALCSHTFPGGSVNMKRWVVTTLSPLVWEYPNPMAQDWSLTHVPVSPLGNAWNKSCRSWVLWSCKASVCPDAGQMSQACAAYRSPAPGIPYRPREAVRAHSDPPRPRKFLSRCLRPNSGPHWRPQVWVVWAKRSPLRLKLCRLSPHVANSYVCTSG